MVSALPRMSTIRSAATIFVVRPRGAFAAVLTGATLVWDSRCVTVTLVHLPRLALGNLPLRSSPAYALRRQATRIDHPTGVHRWISEIGRQGDCRPRESSHSAPIPREH